MRPYHAQAVVLRQQPLGEADRIITLLTRDHGLVRAVAKGVRRTRSKFGASVEPFTVLEALIHPGRSLDIITQTRAADTGVSRISADYEKYLAAACIVEAAERLVGEERLPAAEMYSLVSGVLGALSATSRSPEYLIIAFLLRAAEVAGWALAVDYCASCGEAGEHERHHPRLGGSLCARCAPPGSPRWDPAVRGLLRAVRSAQWPDIDAAEADAGDLGPLRRRALNLVAAHIQLHVDIPLRTLPALDTTAGLPVPVPRIGQDGAL